MVSLYDCLNYVLGTFTTIDEMGSYEHPYTSLTILIQVPRFPGGLRSQCSRPTQLIKGHKGRENGVTASNLSLMLELYDIQIKTEHIN